MPKEACERGVCDEIKRNLLEETEGVTKCLLYYNNAVNTAATAAAAAAAATRTFINLITFTPLDHPREDRKQQRPQAAPYRPPLDHATRV